MKERPIIFSGPMVRAILAGRKTQTRRIIKNPERLQGLMLAGEEPAWCPYGGPGDLLYVRESFRVNFDGGHGHSFSGNRESFETYSIHFKADGHENQYHFLNGDPVEGTSDRIDYEALEALSETGPENGYRPSIHMPKWAARIWLRVESVSADKLQEITEADAEKEGMCISMTSGWSYSCRAAFQELWDKINKDRGSWESNPPVWVVDFSIVSTTGRPEKV